MSRPPESAGVQRHEEPKRKITKDQEKKKERMADKTKKKNGVQSKCQTRLYFLLLSLTQIFHVFRGAGGSFYCTSTSLDLGPKSSRRHDV